MQRFVLFLLCLMSAGLTVPVPAAAAMPETKALQFAILRHGKEIGVHQVVVREEGARQTAEVKTRITITIGRIPVYRYRHDSVEHWRNGRIQTLESSTDDGGDAETLSVHRQRQFLHVAVNGKTPVKVDGTVFPSSHWHPSTPRQTQFFDTRTGEIYTASFGRRKLEPLSGLVPGGKAFPYRMTGDREAIIWYTKDREWAGLRLVKAGAPVVFQRTAVTALPHE
jgi:hypothetical protein